MGHKDVDDRKQVANNFDKPRTCEKIIILIKYMKKQITK